MMRAIRAALYSCRKLLMPEVSTTSATPSPAGSHISQGDVNVKVGRSRSAGACQHCSTPGQP